MTDLQERFQRTRTALDAATGTRAVRLLAVSKTQPAESVRAMAALGQRAFGENYVQEALTKQRDLADLDLEWHLIGPLQSNKCKDAAAHFDWVQSIDRDKLIPLLATFRPPDRAPLNLLVQVNIDAEAGKSGCAPAMVDALADAIAAQPRLRLRGLMAIPKPAEDPTQRRATFRRMRVLFDALKQRHADIDTLSMGMSDDFTLAIAEGANLVRIGSALFGPRG
ncbi:MAG: YggS family pyridoxal phosphate-dependent enzyme [Rhodanobacteraceae bacterium]|nr:YggS family pyridoxal phosphate-dependent enzyme [Rhodanobacteraceae bacterium]MBL0041048.1 YggS family pyridoxal phosphate-dependent enzyme [Xanthomonadales bacterium]